MRESARLRPSTGIVSAFFDEFLLYSGQYALFYILMNFARDGSGYFGNLGHTLLLVSLLAQTAALARWGAAPLPRFLISLAAPAIYAARESAEGLAFLLDMSHAFFWAFSVSVAALQAAARTDCKRAARSVYEFLITLINVAAFFMVYVYFDLRLTAEEAQASGAALNETLSILSVGSGIAVFLADRSHVYVLIGGVFLAVTIAVGRVKILNLKDRINELFGQYVDPDFRDRIVRENGGEPRERELCVLFADIRDFTALSEKESPARVSGMLNRYFTEWEETVTLYGGTIDKYIGDAVMAVFGVAKESDGLPPSPSPCDSAVSCALEMIRRLPRLRERLAAAGLPAPSGFGVGIDYGPVIMGDLGSERRKNFTVIGDHVNTASRLEALCKVYGRACLLSDPVAARLGEANASRFEPLGGIELRGKSGELLVHGLRP